MLNIKCAKNCMPALALWAGLATAAVAAEAPAPADLYDLAYAQQNKPALVMMGTIDENGFPQIRVMSNLCNPAHAASGLAGKNDFTAYAITRVDTDKLKHLAKNPNMSMYYQSGGQGLLLMGKGEVVTDRATRHAVWDDAFKRMGYADADDPALVFLRFTPTHGKFYHQREQHNLSLPQVTH